MKSGLCPFVKQFSSLLKKSDKTYIKRINNNMTADNEILTSYEREFQQQDLKDLQGEVKTLLNCSGGLAVTATLIAETGMLVSESMSGISAAATEAVAKGYGSLFMAIGTVSLSWALSDYKKYRERQRQIF